MHAREKVVAPNKRRPNLGGSGGMLSQEILKAVSVVFRRTVSANYYAGKCIVSCLFYSSLAVFTGQKRLVTPSEL